MGNARAFEKVCREFCSRDERGEVKKIKKGVKPPPKDR